jgi:predicted ATP-grasp superfamily ATP-dependent carboligase
VAAVSRDVYAAQSRAAAAFVAVPNAHDVPSHFAAAVAQAAADLGVSAILPGTEASMIALARDRPGGVRFGAPDAAVVDLATDKPQMLALAAAHGFKTPPSTIAIPSELQTGADKFAYPVILKPQRTRLELDDDRLVYFTASRVDSAGELRAALANLPDRPWVVQPYIHGELHAVAGVAWEGAVQGTVHQFAHRIWPPGAGYSSYAETIPRERELDQRVAGLVGELGWSGLFQLQMLRGPDGERLLIDFNPRAYGSLSLAVAAGANLAAAWADLVHGVVPAPLHYRPGVRYRLEHTDARAIGAMAAHGDFRGALRALRPRRGTVHAVFSWHDPRPMLVYAHKLRGRLIR